MRHTSEARTDASDDIEGGALHVLAQLACVLLLEHLPVNRQNTKQAIRKHDEVSGSGGNSMQDKTMPQLRVKS